MNAIIKNMYQHPMLTLENLEEIAGAHHRIEMEKGTVFLKEQRTANEYYLLESGLVRAFALDYDGNESTTEFFIPGDIVIVPTSLFQRIPSQESLQALTDLVLWKIAFEDFQQLYHQIRGFSEWGRLWFTSQLFALKQRSLDMVRETATHRYLKLLESKPLIVQQAPLKQIASYLGVTDSSLSRIRKEISV
ncbi:Crp/Fnr family transcriptional regulator [Niabella terrae]